MIISDNKKKISNDLNIQTSLDSIILNIYLNYKRVWLRYNKKIGQTYLQMKTQKNLKMLNKNKTIINKKVNKIIRINKIVKEEEMVINKEIETIIINKEEIKIQEEIRTIIGIIKIKIIIKEIEMIEMKEMIVMIEMIEMTEMTEMTETKEMKEMSKMIEMIEMKEMKDMIEIINKEETEMEDNIEKVSIVS